MIEKTKTALIEIASAAGITLLKEEEAMEKENDYHNMVLAGEQVFRLIHTIKG